MWSTYLALAGMINKKTFHIPSSGPSYHSSGSPSVSMCVHPSTLLRITPNTFISAVPSDKPMILVL